MTLLVIISFLVISHTDSLPDNCCKSDLIFSNSPCETQVDSLTKRIVYTSADISPENAGGQSALMRQYAKINLDTIPEDYDTKFIIAFIVDIDGSIFGERIIKDKTNKVGKQILDIVKTFKWTPAICNGKKVAMLHRLEVEMIIGND